MKAIVKYRVIFRFSNKYEIKEMCKFFDVSRKGYYDWINRKDAVDKDKLSSNLISECQQKCEKTCGYRRVVI